MSAPVRLLLVDDDPLVLRGLRLMLAGAPDLEVVGDVDDGDALVAAVRETTPDVVLLDVRMPRVDGVTALRLLRAEPDLELPAVIVLTTFDTERVVLDAMRAGAAGFLLKHTPPAELVRAVHAAAAGEPVVSPAVLRRLIDHVALTEPSDRPHGTTSGSAAPPGDVLDLSLLTDREREVALAVAEGLGNTEIARELYLSPSTVKSHLSSALTKFGLTNRTQLAIAVHEANRRG
ncbi:response regulator [Myceligenerans pegani]|uniref:Response regulator transcription factor n=1 Tax=Myceligenerans pegani TaxID=2776917 RepID=A0ABR9MXC3_9MICO|nr:response regulator transcription factor [Myceligenerans sp. TRM 65318]MBE1875498.1 response regulator transcription factor [Myceligenerans sp. TRM 65318]MBE3017769.1 response regulator transcription factor [Myceligenerans sp. TRM 65318]